MTLKQEEERESSAPNPQTTVPKRRLWTTLKAIISGVVALLAGFFGFLLLFADLGPGETFFSRYTITVLLHLVFGFIFGLVNARAWPVSGLVAWGGILMAVRGALDGPRGWPDALTVMGLAPLPALGGGYLGAIVVRRRVLQRLFRRRSQ